MDATPPISRAQIVVLIVLAIIFIGLIRPSFAMEGSPVTDDDIAGRAIVFIDNGNGLECSGVVFRRVDILTAAHCVVGDDNKPVDRKRVRVYYGSRPILGASTSKSVREIVVYPHFVLGAKIGRLRHADPASSDLAILKMSEAHPANAVSATILPKLIAASLASEFEQHRSSQSFGVAYGFGLAHTNDVPILRYGQMIIDSPKSKLDMIDGRSRLNGIIRKKTRTALCHGDSGGAIFLRIKKNGRVAMMRGQPILAGLVVSAGAQSRCSTESRMINVSPYYYWLVSQRH